MILLVLQLIILVAGLMYLVKLIHVYTIKNIGVKIVFIGLVAHMISILVHLKLLYEIKILFGA